MASQDPQPGGQRLASWKEIAAYLNRDARTVQRWEKAEGLPVHRHRHESQASVYAYPQELDAWLANRGQPPQPDVVQRSRILSARTWRLAGIALVLAAALATPASRELGSVLPFHERDWVLVDAFDDHTGDPGLEGALKNVLASELSNSSYLFVTPRERVEDTLRLMRRSPDTKLDLSLAREVCLRDGIRALVTGVTEKHGTTYLLTIEVKDPVRNLTVAAYTESAPGPDQVWLAVRRLSGWVRESLGESMDRIERSNREAEKVTTPSLRAFQLFTEADNAAKHDQWPAAAQLSRQSVEEDPNFASAHNWLAWALSNLRDPAWKVEAQRALDLSGSVSERERLFIQASYDILNGQQEQAIPVLEALVRLYPDHYFGYANLANVCQNTGRTREALDVLARAADLRPNDYAANARAEALIMPYDVDRGSYYAQRARALQPPSPLGPMDLRVMFSRFLELWLRDDAAGALKELERLEQSHKSGDWGPAKSVMGTRYVVLGRFQDAKAFWELAGGAHPYDALDLAFYSGDEGKAREDLSARLQLDEPVSLHQALLAAHLQIPGWESKVAASPQNEGLVLALQQGHTAEAASFFRSIDQRMGRNGTAMAADGLSTALEQSGEVLKAAEALEKASPVRNEDPLGWLRNQAHLAALYRKLDRNKDARKVEDQLRKLLAVADPDHPILRQLPKN